MPLFFFFFSVIIDLQYAAQRRRQSRRWSKWREAVKGWRDKAQRSVSVSDDWTDNAAVSYKPICHLSSFFSALSLPLYHSDAESWHIPADISAVFQDMATLTFQFHSESIGIKTHIINLLLWFSLIESNQSVSSSDSFIITESRTKRHFTHFKLFMCHLTCFKSAEINKVRWLWSCDLHCLSHMRSGFRLK